MLTVAESQSQFRTVGLPPAVRNGRGCLDAARIIPKRRRPLSGRLHPGSGQYSQCQHNECQHADIQSDPNQNGDGEHLSKPSWLTGPQAIEVCGFAPVERISRRSREYRPTLGVLDRFERPHFPSPVESVAWLDASFDCERGLRVTRRRGAGLGWPGPSRTRTLKSGLVSFMSLASFTTGPVILHGSYSQQLPVCGGGSPRGPRVLSCRASLYPELSRRVRSVLSGAIFDSRLFAQIADQLVAHKSNCIPSFSLLPHGQETSHGSATCFALNQRLSANVPVK